ncbi:SulA-like leucine-rich domain-containing protein [Orbus wheelerorum]|uniref:SulA-like leucine-rich domain-containing protein n=1 Tax=Orbus wheelerorum TaxID=3074111 RepID=UPI00370D5B6A
MLNVKRNKTSNQIHLPKDNQLSMVSFESPLQQVLQQQQLLLNLLNQQNKWQFWISSRPMLKRSWLNQAGLNHQKIIHLSNVQQINMIDMIEKALLAKTSSYVVACINDLLNDSDKYRLQQAVKTSGTHLFLIDDNFLNYNDFMTMSLGINNLH